MASLGLTFDLLARDRASSEFRKVGDAAEKAGKQGQGFGSAVSGGMKVASAALIGAGIGTMFAGFVKDAAESARIGRLTSQVIESTGGAANVTAKQVEDLATAISNKTGVDDEAIQSGQNMLLTFTNVRNEVGKGNDIFNQATQTVTDMSTALGQDTKSSAIQLGKALNDPIKGVTALQRVGVSFTQSQREQIKTLVESGDILGAQKIILAELGKEFGGAAEAAADPISRLTTIAGNLGEEIGGKVLPVVNGFADFAAGTLIPAIGGAAEAVGDAVRWFKELPGPVQAGAVALGAWAIGGGKVMEAFGRLKTGGASKVLDDLRLKMMYAKEEGEGLRGRIGAVGSTAGDVAKGSLKSLARAIGPELGIALAVAAIANVADSIHTIATAGDNAREEVDQLNDALDGTFGADRISTTAANIDSLRDSLAGTRAELEELQTSGSIFGSAGNALGLLGVAADAKNAQESIDVYRQALEDAEAQQAELNVTTETLAGRFRISEEQVLSLADKYKIDLSGGVAESRRLFENFYSQEYGRKPTEATIDFADSVDGAKTELQRAKDAVDAYKLSLDILTGANVSAIEVESAFQDAVAAADDAVKDLDGSVKTSKGGLNLHSEAGRAASDVLLDIRDSGNQLISTLIDQGASTDEVTRKDQKLRESFIKSARQMGFSQDEARKLADDILGIPAERETQIKADTKAANDAIDAVQRNIDNTTGKTITVQVRAAGRFIVNPNGGLQEFWKGGYTGPGGMFDVKGLVHGDEFVVPKRIVRSMGGPDAVAAAVGMGGDIGAPTITLVHDTRSIENDLEKVANAVKSAQSGTAGSGSVSGGWQSIWNYVKARVPQARINSTYRPGDPGYHGLGKAIDFGYGSGPGGLGSAGLALINRVLHDGVGRNLAELIYDGYGDDRPDLKNGRPLTYSYGTQLEHRNHVHAAVYDSGGILPPGLTMAYNGTGRNEHVVTSDGQGLVGLRIEGRLDASGYLDGVVVGALTAAADRGDY